MADINRIKNNIRSMIDQGAPESDIDGYIDSEGVTLEELQAPSNAMPSADTPAPPPPPSLSMLDVGQQAIQNFPKSAMQAGKDIVTPFMEPVETAKALGNLGLGVIQKAIPGRQESEKYADALGEYFANRYVKPGAIKRTIANDPAGFLLDLSTVLSGGATAGARLPGQAGVIAQKAGKVAQAIDPTVLAYKGITKAPGVLASKTAEVVGGLGTGTGGAPLIEAAKAGLTDPFIGRQGQRAKDFRAGINETANLQEVVDDAKRAVLELKKEKSVKYREQLTKLGKNPTIIEFDDIQKAVNEANKISTFKGQNLRPATNDLQSKIQELVGDWRNLDPKEFHTAEGLDALKQQINNIDIPLDQKSSLAVRRNVTSSIKDAINKADDTYADMMKDYQKAAKRIDDLEGELSLGARGKPSTAYRKLTSALRDNVQTNYGQRKRMVDLLESKGATSVAPTIAGEALRPIIPRGLNKYIATLGTIGLGAGAGFGVGLPAIAAGAAALPFMSPRLMGELAYAGGRTAGTLGKALPIKTAQTLGRTIGDMPLARRAGQVLTNPATRYGAFQTGRMANQQEDPYLLRTGR
tara:strand:+ start:883 stop:2625 length:1743 start_codon:yes stop_codon:yes gene_type:complete